jgi:hypothetical protein
MSELDKWGEGWSNLNGEGVEIVIDDDGGAGYDWDITSLVRRPVGDVFEYAIYEDSGCSCRSPYEESPSYYDLSWSLDPFALIKKANLSVNDRVKFRQKMKEILNGTA